MISGHTGTLRPTIAWRTHPRNRRIRSGPSRRQEALRYWQAGRARGNMMSSAETGYQLGSDAAELQRLDLQGRVLAPATRTILAAAGVRPGSVACPTSGSWPVISTTRRPAGPSTRSSGAWS